MGILIEPPNTASFNIRAFFSTRKLVGENEQVRDVLAKELDIPRAQIYLPVQKHTNTIHVLETETEPVTADAVITGRKDVLIGVLVADCVPILLYDGKKEVAGAVHAGWRGTATQILKNTITAMTEKFNCLPENISVAIGPSIRQCSYEVGEDVKNGVKAATGKGDYFYRKGDKYFVDLSTANRIQALNAGIPQENVWQSEECTFCSPERFYSYRYAKGTSTGRQGGFIGMW